MPGTSAAQTDDVVRSATILPGVPLPAWALPEGPIAPELTSEPVGEPVAEAVVEEVVEEPEALGFQDTVAFSAYSPPMALTANGPAAMRAGWGFPGNDTTTPAEQTIVLDLPAVPDDIAGITGITGLTPPPPVPLDAPDPQTLVSSPGAEPTATAMLGDTDDTSPETTEDASTSGAGRSGRPLVLVGAVGAVVVAAALAAFVWPGLLVTADPEPESLPAKPAPVVAPARVVLAAPAQVGGLTRVSGAADTALTRATTKAALAGLTAPVSGVYGIGTTPTVTVIAWENGAALDATAIPAAFAGFTGSSGAEVSDIVTTAAGDLAGQMRCGTTVVSATPASLCFWVDNASFGSVTVLRPASPEAGAETAIAVRASVETKA